MSRCRHGFSESAFCSVFVPETYADTDFENVCDALQGKPLDQLCSWDCGVDPAVDASVARTALGLCAIALTYFPTKLEEDKVKLKDAALTPDARAAIQFRAGKKQVLADAIASLRVRVEHLSK